MNSYSLVKLLNKLVRAYYDGRHHLTESEVQRILEECADDDRYDG